MEAARQRMQETLNKQAEEYKIKQQQVNINYFTHLYI